MHTKDLEKSELRDSTLSNVIRDKKELEEENDKLKLELKELNDINEGIIEENDKLKSELSNESNNLLKVI